MTYILSGANGGAALRYSLAVLAAGGLTLAGCTSNTTGLAPTVPPPPVPSTPMPGPPAPATPHPTAAALAWASSMCQALRPVFGELGGFPHTDLRDPVATRQAYLTYLGNTVNAVQEAVTRVDAVGAPPVANGQQIQERIHNQLIRLRDNLNDALARLDQAQPDDAAAMGRAFAAAGDVIGLAAALTTDPQLRAALQDAPGCQELANQPGPAGRPR